jgi:hypothetical protein
MIQNSNNNTTMIQDNIMTTTTQQQQQQSDNDNNYVSSLVFIFLRTTIPPALCWSHSTPHAAWEPLLIGSNGGADDELCHDTTVGPAHRVM